MPWRLTGALPSAANDLNQEFAEPKLEEVLLKVLLN